MISIVTATFNRAGTLPRLFRSLQEQTVRGFEWIIVDDGSTDGTAQLCAEFCEQADFPVRVARQKNRGKHVALNQAAQMVSGEWVFFVDSDDYLPPDSLQRNQAHIAEVAADETFAGVAGLRVYADGRVILGGKELAELPRVAREGMLRPYLDVTPRDYRFKYRIPGDRAEIIRAELFSRFRFPEFAGENFLSEFYLWQSLSNEGLKLRFFTEPTYITEYLPGGLTRNMREKMRANPCGRSWEDGFALGSKLPLRAKLRHAINYFRYGRLAGISACQLVRDCPRKVFVPFALPVSLLTRISG